MKVLSFPVPKRDPLRHTIFTVSPMMKRASSRGEGRRVDDAVGLARSFYFFF